MGGVYSDETYKSIGVRVLFEDKQKQKDNYQKIKEITKQLSEFVLKAKDLLKEPSVGGIINLFKEEYDIPAA
jgi:hypothetical protein